MSRKKQVNQKITALYCRISLDDGSDNESMSISNQKLMLRDFAEKNGMFQYEYYVDDGYTGRNFNRPSFQRMIADIEAVFPLSVTERLSRTSWALCSGAMASAALITACRVAGGKF